MAGTDSRNLLFMFNQEGEHKGNKILENGAAAPLAAASLIRSHSISNDLHGVQPDPVAADILRKEPEQESFIKLLTAPNGITQSNAQIPRNATFVFYTTRRRTI